MPPRSPLPQRQGVDAAWARTPDRDPGSRPLWETMRDFLVERLPPRVPVEQLLAAGEFVDQAGRPWTGDEPYRPSTFVWFHRPLAPEPVVPFPVEVLYRDDRLVVVDKPHFLASTPRGTHIVESALVRVRTSLGLPDLAAAHRLDRLTAGVLMFTTHREHRGAYAGIFQSRQMHKTYEALAPADPALDFPRRVSSRIEKQRGNLQAEEVEGEPNAETWVELVETRGEYARYRLTPTTGRIHQLRVQMATLGLPILGDPLYPEVLDVPEGEFTSPMQLIARRLCFTDPVDQTRREYASRFALTWPEDTVTR